MSDVFRDQGGDPDPNELGGAFWHPQDRLGDMPGFGDISIPLDGETATGQLVPSVGMEVELYQEPEQVAVEAPVLDHSNFSLPRALKAAGIGSRPANKITDSFARFGRKHKSPMCPETGLDAVVVTKHGGNSPTETHVVQWAKRPDNETALDEDMLQVAADIGYSLSKIMELPGDERDPEAIKKLRDLARANQLEMTERVQNVPLNPLRDAVHTPVLGWTQRFGWFPHETSALAVTTRQTYIDLAESNRLAVARDLTVLLPLIGKSAWTMYGARKSPELHRTATVVTFSRIRPEVPEQRRYARRIV